MAISDFILSLRLTEVRIPNHTVRNSTARLECHYDMDGEELYSVKWYKDGHEFYRYIPRSMPPALVFFLPGINVDVSATHKLTTDYLMLAHIIYLYLYLFLYLYPVSLSLCVCIQSFDGIWPTTLDWYTHLPFPKW